jgi:23S rRNA (guanine745-N1)-methyltransferase
LLRCPVCKSGFTAAAGALTCRNGHSFDLARDGYVNLLRGRRRRPSSGGDSLAQLRHRAEFLDGGCFDPLAATIATHVDDTVWIVLDGGSGTGHHLAAITARLPSSSIGLGLDISKDAARLAVRRWPKLAFAVADLWAEWPVHNAAVDLVVSIFAPKNSPEAMRVLRPGGWLAVAYPGRDHLIELRKRFGLLRQHEDKSSRYAEMAEHFIGPSSITRLGNHATLDPVTVLAAILMGPNTHHLDPSLFDVVTGPIVVTIDINVLFARKPLAASK